MCVTCQTTQFDSAAAEQFAGKMIQHLNGAAVMLMTSLGHRSGLLDAMGGAEPLTTHELAQKAELSERYVREWLGAMTTAGITTYDPATGRYALPAEHAAFLTRAAAPNNLAATAQWVAVLGQVEDQVLEAFRHGRGVPYSAYARFPEVMAEESSQTTIGGMDEHIIPLVPGLLAKLERGIDVVDVGCGRGLAMMHLAKRFPNSRFLGVDLLDDHIADATVRAENLGLKNVRFEQHDVTNWKPREAFDLVFTFDAIHDQARPDLVLANIRGALKPGGVYLMQDIKASSQVEKNAEHPLAPFIYTISTMHCMSVSLAGGGMGLGAAWGKELAVEMLADAGFGSVSVNELPHDILNYYYIAKA